MRPAVSVFQIGGQLLDVVINTSHLIPAEELPDWINSVGLVTSYLPEAYWEGLHGRIISALSSQPLSQWNLPDNPFEVFEMRDAGGETRGGDASDSGSARSLALLLACAHSVYHHAGFAQIQTLPELVREKLLPLIHSEEAMLFVMCLSGPFLQRLHSERYMRPLFDLTVQFYRMLHKVDKECKQLKHADAVCDILYHVKYQFTGDSVRQDAERVVRELSPYLQARLRFIAPGAFQPL